MAARLIEAGRLEMKGAVARFKKKGTLEAADRNLAELKNVLARVSPAPDRKLFADLVFGDEIFRVWQEATLLNYKDFLPTVSFNGQDNFRGFIRHVTAALPPESIDLATREFSGKNAGAERFLTAAEFAAYDAALTGGTTLPARKPPKPIMPSPDPEPAPTVHDAMREFELEAARARAERKKGFPLVGASLSALGALMLLATGTAFARSRLVEARTPLKLEGLLAVGGMAGIAMMILGLLYLRKAQSSGD